MKDMEVQTIDNNNFKIPLPESAPYNHLIWTADLPTENFPEYELIHAPMEQFISLCKDPYISMIEQAVDWEDKLRQRYIDGQEPGKYMMLTPRIAFSVRMIKKLGIINSFLSTTTVGYVSFVNGRHRVRIAEYLGAEYIPVQIHKSEVNNFKEYLGLK
jgi:hypothetical protein